MKFEPGKFAPTLSALVAFALTPSLVLASPQFAREHRLSCTACHSVPPSLNADGLAFQASGYRPPKSPARDHAVDVDHRTIPLAAWITARFEDKGGGGASDLFLPKVELVSGGALSETWSYFAEWRIVSLSLNSDGSLGDRGGRFEDLFAEASLGARHAFKIGQFRSLNQVDVSLRLSASEPLLFKNDLNTGTRANPRLSSLDRFSPSSRSPSLGYSFRWKEGERAGDGLFHYVTVPFVGELSIPLGSEASESASFELTGPPKGVFLETFYRRGLRSIGGHAFLSDDAWLATAVGTYDLRGFLLTGGAGIDDSDEFPSERYRGSLQLEYLIDLSDRVRAAPGLRLEEVSEDGKSAAYIPYLAVALPNSTYTTVLQVEYRFQDGADRLTVDFSAVF